jgi:hypothetical protein
MESLKVVTRVLDFVPASIAAKAAQDDAPTQQLTWNRIVSTDSPYTTTSRPVRRSFRFLLCLATQITALRFPKFICHMTVPKAEELVAFANRHENGKVG